MSKLNVVGFIDSSNLRTNDVNIMLNAFRIILYGGIPKYNLVDGIVDEYEDESGIDTGASTNELYDATDDFYQPNTSTNMTLISTNFTAQSQPDTVQIALFQEDVDSITLNTDLIVSVSRDGGTT
ncbi:MAG TPA: hypothetical protein VLB82_14095, partial [Thermodesulfobacteriota bacterium]|nr:hypothetical protein [Thermodesulfobacteriota bacterium]